MGAARSTFNPRGRRQGRKRPDHADKESLANTEAPHLRPELSPQHIRIFKSPGMSHLVATSSGPSISALGDGSRTITISDDQPREDDATTQPGSDEIVGTLRLRGHAGPSRRSRPRVVWDESVVDNENAGKKKSKICCIFRKQRKFDESSSSDSDSDSDVDSCSGHDHNHDHSQSTGHGDGGAGDNQQSRPTPCQSKVHDLSDDDEPNAYERMPGSRKKGKRKAAPGHSAGH